MTHLSLSSCSYLADIYECKYARLGGDHYAVPVCDNDRRYVLICNFENKTIFRTLVY